MGQTSQGSTRQVDIPLQPKREDGDFFPWLGAVKPGWEGTLGTFCLTGLALTAAWAGAPCAARAAGE